MQNSSNLFEHLTNTIDGYSTATDDQERRMFLRATLRALCLVADKTHKALRALAAAVSKETQ